jgi:hypothetical protein
MRNNIKISIILIVLVSFVVPSISSIAANDTLNEQEHNAELTSMGSQYKGHLRIYIAEIESRWDMENRVPYHYSFYDYVYDDPIEIPYLDTYEETFTWQGDVDVDNMIILASVFNEKSERNYANPPNGRPYDAHQVDAAAGVLPGETYTNVKNEDFSHTIFCEIATATWCQYCPTMANEVIKVFESGDYPFFFIEMVTDMSSKANARMSDYNVYGIPAAFYDGGIENIIGAGAGSSYHEDIIEALGQRDVHDLDLTLSSEATGENSVSVTISITNNEELANEAPNNPTITGPSEGKPGDTLAFDVRTTDPDDDPVYYMIDWGDGTVTDWLGPYDSGETVTESYSWSEEGAFVVKVKAKDPDGLETDWTWLKVTMPKNKIINHPLLKWLLSTFPMLEQFFF